MRGHEAFAEGVKKGLMPLGRARRKLGLTFVWDDNGPVLWKGNKCLFACKVVHDIPYITESQFEFLRSLMDRATRGEVLGQDAVEWPDNVDHYKAKAEHLACSSLPLSLLLAASAPVSEKLPHTTINVEPLTKQRLMRRLATVTTTTPETTTPAEARQRTRAPLFG